MEFGKYDEMIPVQLKQIGINQRSLGQISGDYPDLLPEILKTNE